MANITLLFLLTFLFISTLQSHQIDNLQDEVLDEEEDLDLDAFWESFERDHSPSDVKVLTKENFEDVIENSTHLLVEFYAPWCGFCQSLAPQYEKVGKYFKDGYKNTQVVIAKVDGTKEEELANIHSAEGYPTIQYYQSGSFKEIYQGEHESDDIIKYIKKHIRPTTEYITNDEEMNSFLGEEETKILAHVDDNDSEMVKVWIDIASELDDFLAGHVSNVSLFRNGAQVGTVTIFKKEENINFEGDFNKEQILDYIHNEGYPLVQQLHQSMWDRFKSRNATLLAVFLDASESETIEVKKEDLDMLSELAKRVKGKAKIGYLSDQQLAEQWGASGTVFPTAFLLKWENNSDDPKFFVFNEEVSDFSVETGEAFVNDVLAGTYVSYLKSEEIPEDNDNPVVIVVGKNFEKIVYNKNVDVFVNFYAPWCDYCQDLEPVWDELGEILKDTEIVIAKMDTTKNTQPSNIEIIGYPTLLLFKANDKTPIDYDGESNDLDSLLAFLSKHNSFDIDTKRRSTIKEDL